MRTHLDGAAAMAPLESRSVTLADGQAAFVVRTMTGWVAYLNVCPHWGVDLDLGLGDFVDRRVGRIACRNHGAEFEIESGLCVSGPCVGESLLPLSVSAQGGIVTIATRDTLDA